MSFQIVVVTGASAGIGRATAIAFGARGVTVGLITRGEEGLAGVNSTAKATPVRSRSTMV